MNPEVVTTIQKEIAEMIRRDQWTALADKINNLDPEWMPTDCIIAVLGATTSVMTDVQIRYARDQFRGRVLHALRPRNDFNRDLLAWLEDCTQL